MDLVIVAVVAFTVGRVVYGRVTRARARAAGRVNDELWARVGALPGIHAPTGPVHVRAPVRHARDGGSSAVEYGLLVAAIAGTIVGGVFVLGGTVEAAFSQTNSQIGACVTDPGQCPAPSTSSSIDTGGGGGGVPGQ